MIETGEKVLKETRLAPFGAACNDSGLLSAGGRRALLGGIAGLALLAGVAAPVSLDGPHGEFGMKSVFAAGSGVGGGGGGGGGEGGGGGIGGGSDGKRKFPNIGGDDDGDGDDGDGDDDDGPGGDSGGGSVGGAGGGSVGGASTAGVSRGGGGASADVASVASFDAIQAIEGAPAASLPTIQEIFALPDDAVLSGADEMRLISQGWGKPAE